MTVRIAVPRKGRPLEAVLDRVARARSAGRGAQPTGDAAIGDAASGAATTGNASEAVATRADEVISTLRYEKAVTKDDQTADRSVYERLTDYSRTGDRFAPEFTLIRDARDGMPRRVVFDSMTVPVGDHHVQLVGREEPFRALRKHEFALGFDSADLVLEEVVQLREEPLSSLDEVNQRIDPLDTDVRLVAGLGDTVHHTLLATPEACADRELDRSFVADYEGPLCIPPRYERLVEAVLGTGALDGIGFCYPDGDEEEAAVADTGVGVYLTVTGSTAREHGLVVGEKLFPSETVLLANEHETTGATDAVAAELF